MLCMTDVEALGPCPGLHSMTEFGIVAITRPTENFPVRFYGKFTSLDAGVTEEQVKFYNSDHIRPRASEVTEQEVQVIDTHEKVMLACRAWIESLPKPMFISDNNGFDFQFMNYYLWKYALLNPFGHSSTNLGSLYKGIAGSLFESFKFLRETKHTHHPIDDSLGNAEALHKIYEKFGLKGVY